MARKQSDKTKLRKARAELYVLRGETMRTNADLVLKQHLLWNYEYLLRKLVRASVNDENVRVNYDVGIILGQLRDMGFGETKHD